MVVCGMRQRFGALLYTVSGALEVPRASWAALAVRSLRTLLRQLSMRHLLEVAGDGLDSGVSGGGGGSLRGSDRLRHGGGGSGGGGGGGWREGRRRRRHELCELSDRLRCRSCRRFCSCIVVVSGPCPCVVVFRRRRCRWGSLAAVARAERDYSARDRRDADRPEAREMTQTEFRIRQRDAENK